MKMIYAIVRPEKVYEVNKALADAGVVDDVDAKARLMIRRPGISHHLVVHTVILF